MYTHTNFKTKKALKDAVKAFSDGTGSPVTYFNPGPFEESQWSDGIVYLEGPHYPEPHKWYARALAKDGVIIKILS